MAALGVGAGALGGYALARVIGSFVQDLRLPDTVPVLVSATILVVAAVVAALLPAARAARVDVMQALRTE